MADLRALKDRAAELVAKGKLHKAAQTYRAILESDRRDVASRHKLGELLHKLGDDVGAVSEYRQVADAYARDGLLIKAVAVCKVVLEIDPGHQDTQRMLADLYARRLGAPARASSIRGAVPRIPPAELARPKPEPAPQPKPMPAPEPEREVEERVEFPLPRPLDVIAPPPPESGRGLPVEPDGALAAAQEGLVAYEVIEAVDEARAGAGEGSTAYEVIIEAAGEARAAGAEHVVVEADEPLGDAPPVQAGRAVLPRIPLFSDLEPAAFRALTERIALRRAADGEAVLTQGEAGDSFYVVASGRFRVEMRDDSGERVVLARLGEGAFFGEMALLSGEPRAASVLAEGEGELLELRADVLTALCRDHPQVADSLKRFYRQRLLANAMAASPLFRPFGRDERRAIMERFRSREVAAREVVIREGKPSDGLYVILSGTMDVWKRKGPDEVRAGVLRQGDVFGEMSCLSKAPATATVVARRPGTVLRLPRAEFDELIVTYPQVLELVSELNDERQLNLQAILDGTAQWTEEGLVLV